MTTAKIIPAYIFAGFATLVSVSYLDNVRGPLLPVISKQLGINYEQTGYFLTIGSFAAIVSTLIMGKLLKKYSERTVSVTICLICALPGLCAPLVSGVASLMLLGLVMGSGVALMGSICNILTINGSPLHLRGRLLSIQQVMYGVGSFLGPVTFSAFLSYSLPWWSAIVLISAVNVVLAMILAFSLPSSHVATESVQSNKLNLRLVLPVALFAIFVGGEVLTSMWMSTFFVTVANFSTTKASSLNSLFFLIIAGTRLGISILLPVRWERPTILIALAIGICCILLAILVNPIFLPFAGLVGPFFPLFMAQVSRVFPDTWKDVTIWIFASIQLMLGIIHLSVGKLTDMVGIEKAFYLAPALIFTSLILTFIFFKQHPEKSY
ncbi:MAG: MFS transporter [Pseudobacteriovorax sp.]|nr:MFS transporter [Pseudobacteriovorax sp.]